MVKIFPLVTHRRRVEAERRRGVGLLEVGSCRRALGCVPWRLRACWRFRSATRRNACCRLDETRWGCGDNSCTVESKLVWAVMSSS